MPHGLDRATSWSAPRWRSARWACWLGFRATLAPPDPARARRRRRRPGFARVLYRKYYVDELYDALDRAAAGLALARGALARGGPGRGRRRGVNGTAWLSRGLGWLGSRLLQTGQVGVYVVLFLVGALWILRAVIR